MKKCPDCHDIYNDPDNTPDCSNGPNCPIGAPMHKDNESDGPHMRRCSRCGKHFKSRQAADDHIRMVHKGNDHRVTVARDDDEESLADIAIEAGIKRACGEELDPLEESLLPDDD